MGSLQAALGWLSREDRALALTACTLAGRQALPLLRFLAPERAAPVGVAIEAALRMPVRERLAALAGEARRLALRPRLEPGALHPARRAALVAHSPAASSVLGALCRRALAADDPPGSSAHPAGGAAARGGLAGLPTRPVHATVLAVLDGLLREHIAPSPSMESLEVAPAELRALAAASLTRLAAVAEVLGPARLRALLDHAPPDVSAWLRQRLAPEWEAPLATVESAPFAAALAALAPLVRTGASR